MAQINEELLGLLVARTQAGDAKWTRVSGNDQFFLKLKAGAVVLVHNPNLKSFRLAILNSDGEAIESADFVGSSPSYRLVRDLWGFVVDRTFRIRETVNGILNELRRPGPVGGST